MSAWATAMAVSFAMLATLPAFADEKSLFHLPGVSDFRLQQISRVDNESEWPFSVDEGYLLCAYVTGQRTVYFSEIPETDEEPRIAVIATDPFTLMLGGAMGKGLLPQTTSIEDMGKTMRLLGPFEALGKRLCDQPAGVQLRGGEL